MVAMTFFCYDLSCLKLHSRLVLKDSNSLLDRTNQTSQQRGSKDLNMKHAKKNLTKMVIIFNFIFLLSNLTNSVGFISRNVVSPEVVILTIVSNIFLFLTHSSSFLIYLRFDRLFRDAIVSLFKRTKPKRLRLSFV